MRDWLNKISDGMVIFLLMVWCVIMIVYSISNIIKSTGFVAVWYGIIMFAGWIGLFALLYAIGNLMAIANRKENERK